MPAAPAPRSRWTGLLLAGGRSVRMGTEKGSLPRHPEQGPDLFTAVAEQLLGQCAHLLILGGTRTYTHQGQDLPVLADAVAQGGPLQALLDSAEQWSSAYVLVMPLDMPALSPEFLAAGQAAAEAAFEQGTPGLYAEDAKGLGCFPLWLHRDLLPALQAFREQGKRGLFAGLRAAGVLGWTPADAPEAPGGDPFRNLNTPEDLQAWHACLVPDA